MLHYHCTYLSETALLLTFGNDISRYTHEQVLLAKKIIEATPFAGFIETVPAYNSLAVVFNPEQTQTATSPVSFVKERIEQLLENVRTDPSPDIELNDTATLIHIPVCYDNTLGIDLNEISETLQLSIPEIIHIHSSTTYTVFMTGFVPGFPYMGVLDERIVMPRKTSPRTKLAAGSVAIAGNQTGIYPLETPGGWNIIGQTPVRIFDKSRANPFLLKAGDQVKFSPVSKEEYYQTLAAFAKNE